MINSSYRFLKDTIFQSSIDRRIVGVAHVEDFESISDPSKRATCERKALDFAKLLLKNRQSFSQISGVVVAMEQVEK